MKNKINTFFKTYLKTKQAVIVTIVVLIITIAVIFCIFSAQKAVEATTDINEENIVEETQENIEENQEEIEEQVSEENKEDVVENKEEKKVTYKDKTVTIPKSTVATVNSSEDAEKNKKTGGANVSQEQVETMFENIGQKSMGIDVSAHQGKINWAKVKQSGVDFAIIRCGFRGQTAGSIYEDTYFKTNISGAISNGIRVGIYFYSTAINETEALEEAAWVVNKIAPYNITYPVVYDFEDFGSYRCVGVDGKQATKNALIFLNYVRSSGYEPMMYANKRDITNRLSRSSFSCKFWLTHYTENTDYKGSFNMWQYTSKGNVPGISGNVDMNIAYFNYGKVAEPKHIHNYDILVGEEKKATCTQEGSKTYRCSCGETNTEVMKLLEHSYGEWAVETKPTTEKEGLEKRVCMMCNKEETKLIAKLPSNETNQNNTVNNNQSNENQNTECTHRYVVIETKLATCTETGYELRRCTKCLKENKTEIKAKGHTEGDWIIDKTATETEEGSRHKECIMCNKILNIETINKK